MRQIEKCGFNVAIKSTKSINKFKTIIVDDHDFVRDYIFPMHLNEIPEIEIIGKAVDGLDLLKLLQSLKPDIIFMDIQMPRMNGIEATNIVLQKFPNIKIISISSSSEISQIKSMAEAGALGFLTKLNSFSEILYCLREVINNRPYVTKMLKEKINS